ncbi:hypothetical protein GGI13_001537 [Coemansia sp. RSA 455]|nr:hypothetical protein GGI13_001537 [Coemansia sp. RSA 455]
MNVHVIDTIQSLSIDGTVLSFSSLCSLIESLPQMTQLRFQSIEVYEDYDIPDAIARGRFDSFVRKAIQQEPFSRHAERLSRLMFNDTPKL